MMKTHFWILFFLTACYPGIDEPIEVPLPTRLCVRTMHHEWPVPEANIYIKYNTEEYPGYDHPPVWFDTSFQTGADARACLSAMPVGTHWLVAYGADWQSGQPLPVFGSLKIDIDLDQNIKVDTILYVSE